MVGRIYLFIYDLNWDSGGEVAPNIHDNRLEFNSKILCLYTHPLVHALTFEVDTIMPTIFKANNFNEQTRARTLVNLQLIAA